MIREIHEYEDLIILMADLDTWAKIKSLIETANDYRLDRLLMDRKRLFKLAAELRQEIDV